MQVHGRREGKEAMQCGILPSWLQLHEEGPLCGGEVHPSGHKRPLRQAVQDLLSEKSPSEGWSGENHSAQVSHQGLFLSLAKILSMGSELTQGSRL